MSEPRTPGQCAYEAWRTVLGASWLPRFDALWFVLTPVEKRAWEAAAQAVRAESLRQARAAVRHWNEFGPGDGFEETMHALETWLAQEEAL